MSPVKRKTGIPSNKEAIVILQAELKEVGEQVVTLPRLAKAANLTDTIEALKQDSSLTILI